MWNIKLINNGTDLEVIKTVVGRLCLHLRRNLVKILLENDGDISLHEVSAVYVDQMNPELRLMWGTGSLNDREKVREILTQQNLASLRMEVKFMSSKGIRIQTSFLNTIETECLRLLVDLVKKKKVLLEVDIKTYKKDSYIRALTDSG